MDKFTCKHCNVEKDIGEMSSHNNVCRPCYNEKNRERRLKRKEKKILEGIAQGEPVEVNMVNNEPIETKKSEPVKIKEIDKKKIKTILDGVLMSGFNLLALRAGPQWVISPEESSNITEPLVNIMAKLDIFKAISKNSDAVALFAGITAVIAPRAITTYLINKEVKKNESGGPIKEKTDINKDVEQSSPDTGNNKPDTVYNSTLDKNDLPPAFAI
jgi:hypothetical protein